jgi:hypothetical protein
MGFGVDSGDDGMVSAVDERNDLWPASFALIACVALYVVLPSQLVIQPKWVVPALELALLVPLLWHRHRATASSTLARKMSIALLVIINLTNIASVTFLVQELLKPGKLHATGRILIYSAISIWVTNVIVFALWFWEFDRGGPLVRSTAAEEFPDFQFPQMENPRFAPPNWRPHFLDYLYVSLTNAAAFSPTDAMPLSKRAKVAMGVGSIVSLVTVVVVASRAVNILS